MTLPMRSALPLLFPLLVAAFLPSACTKTDPDSFSFDAGTALDDGVPGSGDAAVGTVTDGGAVVVRDASDGGDAPTVDGGDASDAGNASDASDAHDGD